LSSPFEVMHFVCCHSWGSSMSEKKVLIQYWNSEEEFLFIFAIKCKGTQSYLWIHFNLNMSSNVFALRKELSLQFKAPYSFAAFFMISMHSRSCLILTNCRSFSQLFPLSRTFSKCADNMMSESSSISSGNFRTKNPSRQRMRQMMT